MHETKKIVGEIFGMKKEAMKLRPRSWKEPHLLLYQQLDGREPHTGIEMHYDGCDITCESLLSLLPFLFGRLLTVFTILRASDAHPPRCVVRDNAVSVTWSRFAAF